MLYLVRMVLETLLIDHVLQDLFGGFELVPLPVELLVTGRLFGRVVQFLEVLVLKTLFYSQSLVRVEGEHLGEQVETYRVGLGEEGLPTLFGPLG